MRLRKALMTAALAAGLSACATSTPYQPLAPERGGYSEQRIADDRYRVEFAGNPNTSPEQVEAYLLRRAAELTVERGYDWFRVSDQKIEGNVRTVQTRWGPMRVSESPGANSWRNYGSFYVRPGLKLFRPIWRRIRGGPGEALEARAEIVLGRGAPPRADSVFNARQVLQELGR